MSNTLALAGDDRRIAVDRREFGWRTVLYGFLRSRRREARRDSDTDVRFLDWHHPWVFFIATGTMLLSCADAFMTLLLINGGMYEANPVMALAMEKGTGLFVASKMAMTGFGIMLLVYMARTRFLNRIRTSLILTTFFSFYCCLVCYEIVSLMAMY